MDLDIYRNLTHSNIAELGAQHIGFLEAYGTSYNSTDTGAGYIKYTRGNNETTITVNGRGLTIAIFDRSLEFIESTRYDTYGDDRARSDLGKKINLILNGEFGDAYFVIASFDATNSNATLLEVMTNARAWRWSKYGTNGPSHRHPVAIIGCSSLGILKEVIHSNSSGASPAYASMAIPEDFRTVGSEGYGPDLAQGIRMPEYNYSGTGYGIYHGPHLTVTDTGAFGIKDLEYVRMTGQRKVSLERKEAGGQVRSYFWTAHNSDGWISSASHGTTSIEWEEFELYFQWNIDRDTRSSGNPSGLPPQYLRFGHYHYPNNIDPGSSHLKNIQVQRCGFRPTATLAKPSLSVKTISSRETYESPANFSLLNPDTYYSMWGSSRNLTGRPNLGDSRAGSGPFDTNSVVFFDRTLTNRNEYSIHEGKNFGDGDSNRYNDIGYVYINPDKMYLGCIWHNCWQKEDTGGRNYFGTHTLNTAGSLVGTMRAYSHSYATTNPYSMYPRGSDIEKGTWQLWSYWFLPKWFTQDEGLDFYNNYWCKWAGNYENARAGNSNIGNAPSYNPYVNGGNTRVAQFRDGDARIHLRWLDYYNTGTQGNGGAHKTWWALPAIFEVDPMTLSTDNVYSWNIVEQ